MVGEAEETALANVRRIAGQRQQLTAHGWADDQQTLEGLTPVGRATITALNMNSQLRKEARQLWFGMGLLP